MPENKPCHSAIKWLGAAAGFAATAYAAHAGIEWLSYGHAKLFNRKGADKLLDVFMPEYEVAERHSIGVAAPADKTFAAATEMNVDKQFAVRAIFKAREFLLRSKPDQTIHPAGMLAAMQ